MFGRKITFTYLDDGYDPGRAVNNTIRLIQQEQVFAVFSSLGTSNNLAVRKLLNDAKVPQLYVSSGATTFGRDYKKYPWTIGYIPPYSEEGELYGRYVVKNVKKPKIAVLYQNDDYGRDLLAGLKRGLGSKTNSIVASVGYDPTSADVQPQVTQLKASKANVLMVFAFGKFSLQAFNAVSRLGWKPQIFVNDVSSASALMAIVPQKAANGSISIVFGKDPASPIWRNDKGIKLFQSILKKYGSSVNSRDLQDGYFTAGMATAYTMVNTLKKAGKNLDPAERDERGHAPEREGQSLRPAGHRHPHDTDEPVPAHAGPAAALVEQQLASLRQADLRQALATRLRLGADHRLEGAGGSDGETERHDPRAAHGQFRHAVGSAREAARPRVPVGRIRHVEPVRASSRNGELDRRVAEGEDAGRRRDQRARGGTSKIVVVAVRYTAVSPERPLLSRRASAREL